jgi:DEAD/DEAH box helicase domain-containing protein
MSLIRRIHTYRYYTHPNFWPFPSGHVSIRGGEEEKYVAVDVGFMGASSNILEEVEISRAIFELYEGGVVSRITHIPRCAALMFISVVPTPRIYIYCKYCAVGSIASEHLLQVKEVDHDKKMAKLLRADVNWITSPR